MTSWNPQNSPPNEVTGIFVYCFSCRYLVELGLRQLGLPVPNMMGLTQELLTKGRLQLKSCDALWPETLTYRCLIFSD